MVIRQEMHFHNYRVRTEKGFSEHLFLTFGTPAKTMKDIQQEAEDEFYFLVSENKTVDYHDILFQKFTEYGYHKIETGDNVYYEDSRFLTGNYVKDLIQAEKGEQYYNEHFKTHLNQIRIQKGKEPLLEVEKSFIQEVSEYQYYCFYIELNEVVMERIFVTDGEPVKAFADIKKEVEEEFYFLVSEGEDVFFPTLFFKSLETYGYEPVTIQDADERRKIDLKASVRFTSSWMSATFVEKMIKAKPGDVYYDQKFKERLDIIRMARQKEPLSLDEQTQEIVFTEQWWKPKNEIDIAKEFEAFERALEEGV